MAGRFPGPVPNMMRPWSLKLASELMDYLRKQWHGMSQLQSLSLTTGSGSSSSGTTDDAILLGWLSYLELN